MDYNVITVLRVALAVAGVALAAGAPSWTVGDDRRQRAFRAALIVCAAASLYLAFELGPQFGNVKPRQIMNPHDFYHYYIGAKYHEELGYFDMYECTVIADWDSLRTRGPRWRVRDLKTYSYHKAEQLARRPQCKARFTEERWREFERDVRYFSRSMASRSWELVLKDKGYNATPVWTRFAGALTNMVSLDNTAGMYALLSLDYLFTLAILAMIGVTFGWRNALFATLFWGVNFMASTTFVKGSISRFDWLMCLVGALCLIRRGRYGGAGLLAGIATCLRLFPALFFVGLFFKCVWTVIRKRAFPREYLRFGVVMLLTVGVLVGLTALTRADRQDWQDFAVKIRGHDSQIAGYRVGFKYAVIDPDLGSLQSKAEQFASRKPIYWGGIAVVLAVLFVAAPRVEDYKTLALSFACVFFMTAPTFYYYQMLIVPFLMFLPRRERPASAGMSVLFGWCVLGYTWRLMWQLGGKLSFMLSWSLVGLCALILLHAFWETPEARPEATTPASG